MYLFAIGLLVFDQIYKFYLTKVSTDYIVNPGVAFGVGTYSFVFVGLFLLVLLATATKLRPKNTWFLLGLAVASNVVDRVRTGGVVDYLHLGALSFNLADVLILLLVAVIGYMFLTDTKNAL